MLPDVMMRLVRNLQIEKLQLVIQNGYAVPKTNSFVPRTTPKVFHESPMIWFTMIASSLS